MVHRIATAFVAAVSIATCITAGSRMLAGPAMRPSADALNAPGNQVQRDESADALAVRLRAEGPEALARLVRQRQAILEHAGSSADAEAVKAMTNKRVQIDDLIDRVAGQRYACVSHLYWYTDLDEAKAAAAASSKPILSLRMLGKLTDEFSCANSRFFRTTLYANQEISQRLRERFVLHWKSVRSVPRVTIDFGDGRKLERTITGNSVHYALAADGQPLDALPGLYGPGQFMSWLTEVEMLHAKVAPLSPEARAEHLAQYHAAAGRRIASQWARDLLAVAPERVADAEKFNTTNLPSKPGGSVVAATRLAQPKGKVEMPILRLLTSDPASLAQATTDDAWTRMAALPAHSAQLDAASVQVIRRENPTAARAGALAVTKRAVEDPILRLVGNLQTSIAIDTVRNEYTLHRHVHEWFAAGQVPADADQLNTRVYAELFLTPDSDPWLGLVDGDTYTALERGGVVQP